MSIKSGRLKYYRRLKTSRFNFVFIIRNRLFKKCRKWKILWDVRRAWSGDRRRSRRNRGNENGTSNNTVIQHQINSYFQLNHEMEKIIHFSSAPFELEWVPPKVVLVGWEGRQAKPLLLKLKWEFSSIEAQMKNGVVFDLFVRWKVFYSFLSLRVTPCWHSRRTKNHKLKTYWH